MSDLNQVVSGVLPLENTAHESAAAETLIGKLRRLGRNPWFRLLAFVVMLTLGVVREAKYIGAFSADDLWLHIRIGTWILQHHAVPRTGLYSQFSTALWIDFSYPYEAFLAALYSLFGLRAVPLLLMMFKVVLAAVAFFLAGGLRRFWTAIVLSVLTQYVLLNLTPLPVFFSICSLALALYCLLESRRKRDLRPMLLMPPLFYLWANLDAQFLLGLALVLLFLLAEILERVIWPNLGQDADSKQRIPFTHLLAVALGCLVAVTVNPYFIRIAGSAFHAVYSPVLFKNFGNMAAMSFRQPADYILLLMLLLACLKLGLDHSRDLFKILLLICGAALSFRIQRDSWIVALPVIAILGELCGGESSDKNHDVLFKSWQAITAAAAVVVVLVCSFEWLPSNGVLASRLEAVVPVNACKYIEANNLAKPLFSEYSWAGFTMWKLPDYPVAVDQRLNLYGDTLEADYFDVIMGKERMESYPNLADANTLLLPSDLAITKALTSIPVLQEKYREVYRDKLAVIFVRR